MCGYFCSKSSITASVRSWRSCDPHQAMRKVTCSCAKALIARAATKKAASAKAAQDLRMVNHRSSETGLYDLPRKMRDVGCGDSRAAITPGELSDLEAFPGSAKVLFDFLLSFPSITLDGRL